MPLRELYQEALVKLVMHILSQHEELSPGERRKAFETYMTMITSRFAAGEDGSGSPSPDQARRTGTETARTSDQKPPEAEERASKSGERDRTAAHSQPTPQPADYSSAGGGYALLAIIVVAIGLGMWNSNGASRTSVPAPAAPAQTTTPQPDYAVAAFSANVRERAEPKSKVIQVLSRGDPVRFIAEQGTFTQVQLESGAVGFIARELLVRLEDARRLSNISARAYVEQRAAEKRIGAVWTQLGPRRASFYAAVKSIADQSDLVYQHLEELEAGQALDLQIDPAAGAWFALAAKYFAAEGKLEDASWESRAAIEADPTNPDNYVAFALTAYKRGIYEDLHPPAQLLPQLAPRSTNSWMILALSWTLTESADDTFAKYALILAMRLSKNPTVTRKYFSDIATNSTSARTRQAFNDALEEEHQRPDLFARSSKASHSASEITR